MSAGKPLVWMWPLAGMPKIQTCQVSWPSDLHIQRSFLSRNKPFSSGFWSDTHTLTNSNINTHTHTIPRRCKSMWCVLSFLFFLSFFFCMDPLPYIWNVKSFFLKAALLYYENPGQEDYWITHDFALHLIISLKGIIRHPEKAQRPSEFRVITEGLFPLSSWNVMASLISIKGNAVCMRI